MEIIKFGLFVVRVKTKGRPVGFLIGVMSNYGPICSGVKQREKAVLYG